MKSFIEHKESFTIEKESSEQPTLDPKNNPFLRSTRSAPLTEETLELALVDPGVSRKARLHLKKPAKSKPKKNLLPTNPYSSSQSVYFTPRTSPIEMAPGTSTTTAGPSGQDSGTGQNTHNSSNPRKSLPLPHERNAPSFDEKKPQELLRFLDTIELYFRRDGVTDDDEKKNTVVRYTEPHIEAEWKSLPSFSGGTWAEFKDELVQEYPDAADLKRGSMRALEKNLKAIGKVDTDDIDLLNKLRRVFRVGVDKLNKLARANAQGQATNVFYTNKELVDLFLDCLTSTFVKRVETRLDIFNGTLTKAQKNARIPEDWFTIEEVMEFAHNVAEEQKNPYLRRSTRGSGDDNVDTQSSSKRDAEANVKIEEGLAQMKDTAKLRDQQMRALEEANQKQSRKTDDSIVNLTNLVNRTVQMLQNQQSLAQKATPQGTSGFQRPGGYDQTDRSPQPVYCYYCGHKGHIVKDCVIVIQHLDLKWVIRDSNNLIRWPTGAAIISTNGIARAELVENKNKPKPGIMPMSQIEQKYFGTVSQNVQVAEADSNMYKLFQDYVEQCGVGQMQKLLGTDDQSGTDQTQSSSSNFI